MCILATLIVGLATGAGARSKTTKSTPEPDVPPLLLAHGRSLSYERSFSSEREVKLKSSFWGRVLGIVAGAPEFHQMVWPYGVATDSRGRVIVTDPGLPGVHIFDFAQQKYKFLSREEGRDAFQAPQCVAVDAQDNIYITDSEAGKIFVYDAKGKFRRALGSLKGGEGFFKRPTGIAVDSTEQRIYVSDTLRHKIFVLDFQGAVLETLGKRGVDPGEFNFPTEIRLHGEELLVVDAMNFRVQALNRKGLFLYAIGRVGETNGTMYRPKGIGVDSEDNLYVVDGIFDTVQAFDHQGRLLFYFGQTGNGPTQFQLPTGLFIDRNDRIFVVDSFNSRIQVFRYTRGSGQTAGGGQ